MNEIHRQAYLSALGIENYMPRWQLPFAPESVACVLPVIEVEGLYGVSSATITAPVPAIPTPGSISSPVESVIAMDVITNIDIRQKPATPVNAASILQQLEDKKPAAVSPFSLSVWRPLPGFLIIDSRDTRLALPTDLLLNNILRNMLVNEKFNIAEEVLRWPMIENRFVSRTEKDARNELQTWLAVENELRPVNRLWLLGENAGKYFIAEDLSATDSQWQTVAVQGLASQTQLSALLLPSLNEILQSPLLKLRLWTTSD